MGFGGTRSLSERGVCCQNSVSAVCAPLRIGTLPGKEFPKEELFVCKGGFLIIFRSRIAEACCAVLEAAGFSSMQMSIGENPAAFWG